MPIVTCPTCGTRYDPGIDDLPDDLDSKVVCPSCGQWVRLPGAEPVDAPNVSPEVLREMQSQSRRVDGDAPRPGRRRPRDDEEAFDDRPRRRRRGELDDEDDPRPSRQSQRDSFVDDFDDFPQRPATGDGLGVASLILGIISCVAGIGGCCLLFGGVSILTGIVAVTLGFIARSQNRESGTARSGIITGFVGIGISVVLTVLNLGLRMGGLFN